MRVDCNFDHSSAMVLVVVDLRASSMEGRIVAGEGAAPRDRCMEARSISREEGSTDQ